MPPPKDPIKYKEYCKQRSEITKRIWKDTEFSERMGEMRKRENLSEETLKKMSESGKVKIFSPEHKANISISKIGKSTKPCSDDTKKKISVANSGKIRSDKFCIDIGNRFREKPKSYEHRKKISKSLSREKSYLYGTHLSKSQKKIISEANKNKEVSESTRQKICEGHIGGFWYGNVRYGDVQYCEKFNNEFKERVRAYFGYVCPLCGTPQGTTALAVHHINFKKDSCCNPDSPRLFIPLCPSGCHSRTNHNRKFWEQYFTDMIMNYYEGKCYFTKEEMNSWTQ